MPDVIRIEVRQGRPGQPNPTTVTLNGKDITSSVYVIDLVQRDALPEGAPCDRAIVNGVPYPVNVRRGPRVRKGLKPGDLVVIAETPCDEWARNGNRP
jgi:hypothetical protein